MNIEHISADVNRNHASDLKRGNPGQLAAGRLIDLRFGILEGDIERVGIAVHQNRNGVHVPDDFSRRGKRHRRHEDALTAREAKRLDREMKGGGPRVDGDRVLGADRGRKTVLEPLHARPRRQPARSQHVDDLCDFRIADVRPKEWNVHGIHFFRITPR